VDDPDLGVTAQPAGADPGELAPTLAADVDVAGGGGALLPGDCPGGCGAVDLDATRVVVEATLEGRAEPVVLVLDTGASALVLRPSVVDGLGDPARPRLDGVTVGTANGAVTAYLTRVSSLAVDAVPDDANDAAGAADALVETSVSTLVLPDEALFDGLSAEVGRRIDGLLGGSFLRAFAISIDYPGQTLRASRYLVRDHIDPNEFVRVGFTMVPDGQAWLVQDVHPGTDADAQGLVPGDEIVSVDGVAITGADADAVSALFTGFGLGDRVPLEVVRGAGGAPVPLDVLVEDLLPNYEGL